MSSVVRPILVLPSSQCTDQSSEPHDGSVPHLLVKLLAKIDTTRTDITRSVQM